MKRFSKYNAKRINGYDSQKEAKRAEELKLLQKSGAIRNLKEQTAFILQPNFRDDSGKMVRAIKYVADFIYVKTCDNCLMIEDVKGWRTKDYIIKSKILKKHIADGSIREICNDIDFDFSNVIFFES